MGISVSKSKNRPEPEKLVLVPPKFERDCKARSRFTKSSYDYLFSKKELAWLFSDYLRPDMLGAVFFSPPADPRLSVKARLGIKNGSMQVRWQPQGPEYPHTFVDINASPQKAGAVGVRASLFDPASGAGFFATAPLAKQLSGDVAHVGLRYSSPMLTAGVMAAPRTGTLSTLWLAGKYEGIMAGVQIKPDSHLAQLMTKGPSSDQDVVDWLRSHTSYALAYEPHFKTGTGQGRFTASMEVQEGRQLVVSFFQHLAVSRRVFNPLEGKNIMGITNYIDIGMQITTPIRAEDQSAGTGHKADGAAAGAAAAGASSASSSTSAGPGSGQAGAISIGAAWQVNKNWLAKFRVGTDSASLALALRLWFNPSALLSGTVQYNYSTSKLKCGAFLQIENFGGLRYERGAQQLHGKALVQRHEATNVDIANQEGKGMLVMKEATQDQYNAPQMDKTANYL